MGLSFAIAAGPRQRIHSRVRVPWDSRPYFTLSDSRFPFLSPSTLEVFYPASTRELLSRCLRSSLCSFGVDPQKTPFPSLTQEFRYCYRGVPTSLLHRNGSCSIVACVFVATGICLPSRCLAMDVSSGPTIPAFRRHVTISS
jgi:hypothetical protein